MKSDISCELVLKIALPIPAVRGRYISQQAQEIQYRILYRLGGCWFVPTYVTQIFFFKKELSNF